MTLEEIMRHLVGQTISEVKHSNADSGLIITTKEGNTLDFGYSGCEGFTLYNGERIPELD